MIAFLRKSTFTHYIMRILMAILLVLTASEAGQADIINMADFPFRVFCTASTVKMVGVKGMVTVSGYYPGNSPRLRAARGEWESFQIVIWSRNKPLSNVHIDAEKFRSTNGNKIERNQWMIFRENYVQISRTSARYTESDVLNHWWPDALIPQYLQPSISIEPGKSEVFWLTVRVPENAQAGNYSSDVTVWANGQKRTIKVLLQVEPFAIPAPTMRANVAVYYDVLRDWYTKNIGAMSDAQFAELKKEYYDFLLKYRINAYDLPVPWNSPEAAQYINNPKVLSVRLPPLSQKKELETAIDVLKKNHAMAKGYYYHIDEPSPDRYPEIIDTEKQLHAIDPAIKQCVTIAPNKILDGSVDIWCPNIGDFMGLNHLDMTALTKQRDKGRETWWYTMVEPKYPYPTWLVDDEALSVRSYGGLMAKYGISGFVYSMAHGWGPDPLHNIASFAGTYGDGTLVYPSELVGGHGPMPSIRLMLLRNAIEDYELMKRNFHISLYPEFHVTGPGKPYYDVAALDRLENYFKMYIPAGDYGREITASHVFGKERQSRFEQIRNLYYDFLAGKAVTSQGSKEPWQDKRPRKVIPILDTGKSDIGFPQHAKRLDYFQWPPIKDIRHDNSVDSLSTKIANLTVNDKYLKVLLRADYYPELTSDWVAVELSNTKIVPMGLGYKWLDHSTENVTRWRFVITRKGNAVVEKQTSAGRWIVNDIKWEHKLTLSLTNSSNGEKQYQAEFDIPRDLFPELEDPKGTFRFNFMRHYNRPGYAPFTGYGDTGIGDVFLMFFTKIIPNQR